MRKKISLLIASVMVTALFAGCSSGVSTDTATGISKKDGDITIQFLGKVRQEAFWNAVESGAQKAADDLDINLVIQGDPAGSNTAAKQAQYIESATELGVDAIAFAALDTNTTDDALQKAMAEGIKVVGFDSDPGVEARDWFVNQADPASIAVVCLKDMAEKMTEKGFTADKKATIFIVSTNQTTPNQNTWIEFIKEEYYTDYESVRDDDGAIDFEASKKNTKEKTYTVNEAYANLDVKLDPDKDIIYGADDHTTSKTQISNTLAANKDTNGLIVLTTNAIAAANDSINEKGMQDTCIFNGIAVPTSSKSYLESGVMSSVVLWQAYDLGYLAVESAYKAVKGEISGDKLVSNLSGKDQVEGVSKYSEYGHKIVGKEIILGDPAVFTLDTVDNFKE